MNPKNYSSTGFVIARKKYKEADRIIILFTKDYGRLPLIAKGVRKPTSRKRGNLEVFTNIKFSATKSRSLDIITEVETINSFSNVRNNLKKLSVAYYFCEVVGKVTRDEEKHELVYEIMKRYLHDLSITKNLKAMRFSFVKEILVSIGFWPHDKPMPNPDLILENIIEGKINTIRVGRKMLQHY